MNATIVHLTYTLTDHSTARTLCGLTVRTDHKATAEAKTGPWLSCPLCEAARIIDATALADHPTGRWAQPVFEGADQWQ